MEGQDPVKLKEALKHYTYRTRFLKKLIYYRTKCSVMGSTRLGSWMVDDHHHHNLKYSSSARWPVHITTTDRWAWYHIARRRERRGTRNLPKTTKSTKKATLSAGQIQWPWLPPVQLQLHFSPEIQKHKEKRMCLGLNFCIAFIFGAQAKRNQELVWFQYSY